VHLYPDGGWDDVPAGHTECAGCAEAAKPATEEVKGSWRRLVDPHQLPCDDWQCANGTINSHCQRRVVGIDRAGDNPLMRNASAM